MFASMTPTPSDFHTAVEARIEERFRASGLPWDEFVFNPEFALTVADLKAVEATLLQAQAGDGRG